VSQVFDLADAYVNETAQLDPVGATFEGIAGHDDDLTDYSPDGYQKRADADRRYLKRINDLQAQGRDDEIAAAFLKERLAVNLESFDNSDYLSEMSFAWSPMQAIRSVFDQMSYDSNDDWDIAARRLARVPNAMNGLRKTLELGLNRNDTVARRQVLACARQARMWAGTEANSRSFFWRILDAHRDANINRKLQEKLEKGADAAAVSFDEFSNFLVDVYAPQATEVDGVGRERYLRAADFYLGLRVETQEVYEWGWEELARIKAEIDEVCECIKPGATLREVVDQLNKDHERWIHGGEALVEWLKGLLDRAIKGLNGRAFDIPEALRNLEVRIAPPGGPANQYYVSPSEDMKRPGTYWYPIDGRSRFPMWAEISTAYHEGVPGHHLQLGTAKLKREHLSRFQRNTFVSGHCEGWALYAERLMDELGFYERPEYKLDMLLSQYLRAARVVVDIGLHLGFQLPANAGHHGGETWTPEIAHEFMLAHSNESDAYIESEIVRYLGMPAQAISYKVGERVWRELRSTAQEKLGSEFDLPAWHGQMLELGPMGLAQLKQFAG
jgi:uncharacterized protein (DUF885 family)